MKILKTVSIISVCACAVFGSLRANAEDDIKVYVNNSEVNFSDQAPVIVGDSTMVPIRAVFEKADSDVSWNEETKTATLKNDKYTVNIKIDEPYLEKNGEPIALSVPATIINGRLAIPVRAIAEAMDFGVSWNSTKNSVLISTKGKEYRANAQWKTGFLPLNEAGFMLDTQVLDIPYFDLNSDSSNDPVTFIPGKLLDDGSNAPAALWINGQNYSSVLDNDLVAYAFAIVDVIEQDQYKEIVIMYHSEEGNLAGFYRYNGTDVFKMNTNNTNDGHIPFKNTLYIDGIENVVSDNDGMFFLNDMICTGVYSLEDGNLSRYSLNVDNSVNREYYNEKISSSLLCYTETKKYDKGTYVESDSQSTVINSDDINTVKILDFFVDNTDPSKFEFYVQLSNGTKAVIWSYTD